MDKYRDVAKHLVNEVKELRARNKKLEAEVERLRAALAAVEFVTQRDRDAGWEALCPWCGGSPIDNDERAVGIQDHRPDCARQVALGL